VQQSYSSLITAVAATGRVRKYEVVVSGMMLMIVPVSYVVLRMGGLPWMVFVVYLSIVVLAFIAILTIVLPMINLKLRDYLTHALSPCVVVLLLSLIVPICLKLFLPQGLIYSFIVIFLTVISTSIVSFVFGLDAEVRGLIVNKVNSIINKK
jgi:hypothetical protein